MDKKKLIPIIIGSLLFIFIIASLMGGSRKIKISIDNNINEPIVPDSIDLKVYMENSGSMDGYMCPGSQLKDAVFDYVSDVMNIATTCSLYYINSVSIPYHGTLESYIKDLTPSSFARAGGYRKNTDLRAILKTIMTSHNNNTISIFISDCILDIPENATDYFGNCQISVKNTFNDAIKKNPNLGVEIIQLQSKFDGTWYCGNNQIHLSDKEKPYMRPYYIWILGNSNIIAKLNETKPISEIMHGYTHYCAFSSTNTTPIFVDTKKTYMPNRNDEVSLDILVNMSSSLQEEEVITNLVQYNTSTPQQVTIKSIDKITDSKSRYSHVIKVVLSDPNILRQETISFKYPTFDSLLETMNDDSGKMVDNKGGIIKTNLYKTTGIKYLIKGVAEAFKHSNDINWTLKIHNK